MKPENQVGQNFHSLGGSAGQRLGVHSHCIQKPLAGQKNDQQHRGEERHEDQVQDDQVNQYQHRHVDVTRRLLTQPDRQRTDAFFFKLELEVNKGLALRE